MKNDHEGSVQRGIASGPTAPVFPLMIIGWSVSGFGEMEQSHGNRINSFKDRINQATGLYSGCLAECVISEKSLKKHCLSGECS